MVDSNDERKGIVSRLREVRLKQGLSTRQLGALLGFDDSNISKWETGRYLPSMQNAEKLTQWLTKVEKHSPPFTLNTSSKPYEDIYEQTEQLRYLLNALELNLHTFINGTSQDRSVYRDHVDLYDMNYLISVLEALFDEGKFQRWKMFSNYKFQGFKRGAHARKGKNQGQLGEPA